MKPNCWIKLRSDLVDDPKVRTIARALRISRTHVVGLCAVFWSWADGQTDDGLLTCTDAAMIDEVVAHPGFAAAMVAVGWLGDNCEHMTIPLFDRHMGESAKKRALDAERARRYRHRRSSTVTQNRDQERDDRHAPA